MSSYVARFSYDVRPVDRSRAIDFIRRELAAARQRGLNAHLLVPLTRAQGGAALEFEVELESLDQLDQFRHHVGANTEETRDWMRAFSEILTAPPSVEVLRVEQN